MASGKAIREVYERKGGILRLVPVFVARRFPSADPAFLAVSVVDEEIGRL